jgi:hypothetical protein
MPNPTIKIVDILTGEEIERPMNKDEFDAYKSASYIDPQIAIEAKAKAIARQAIADRLGLTADELQVLLG